MTISTSPTADGKRIEIRFPYDPALVAAVKAIPGAKFDGARRLWTVAKRYSKDLDALNGAAQDADAVYAAAVDAVLPVIREAFARLIVVRINRSSRMADVSPSIGSKIYLGEIGTMHGARSRKYAGKFDGYDVPLSTVDRLDVLIQCIRHAVAEHRQKRVDLAGTKAAEAAGARARLEARRLELVAKASDDEAAGKGRMGVLARDAAPVGSVIRGEAAVK